MFSRRSMLRLLGATLFASFSLTSYAFAIEPRFRLAVTRYRLRPARWPALDRPLRVAVLADLHACEPWMPISRIEEIVETANALKPELIVLLGDYVAGLGHFKTSDVPVKKWASVLAGLKAPLGTYSILGNHDWWTGAGPVRSALLDNGIPVLENEALLLRPKSGPAFWLAGLGDQLALPNGRGGWRGVHDIGKTLAHVTDDSAPAILLAHEPDIFPRVPERFGLTLSGHTHGGQVKLPFLGRPVVPSRYGQRYAYGHVIENDRHLLVSGGLGMSNLPVRFGVPPEVVLLELG
jgi:uncharacterized protein